MSCLNLNLNKLLPATKAWKIFTHKVQIRLHKLNRSKAIKKPKNRFNKSSKRISWPTLFVQRKRFKPKKPSRIHHFQRKASAVYIDQLFLESVSMVKEHEQPSIKATAVGKDYNKDTPSTSTSGKKDELGDHQVATSEEDTADDMWESLVLASPQMQGINERAEEFITNFRAEMRLQERLDRCL